MKISSKNKYQYCTATVPNVYSNIKVIIGSEEMIYDKKYVTAIVNNNRLVKFLKESVNYK